MKKHFLKVAVLTAALSMTGCSSDSDTSSEPINNVECPEGFTGKNCDIPITPSKVRITRIRVLKFPNLDGSTAWDIPTSSPDIYISVFRGSSNIFKSDNYYPDAVSSNQKYYDFVPSVPILSTNVSDIFDIQLLDYDQEDTISSADDLMGGIFFAPFINENKSSVIVSDLNNTIQYEVFLSYEW